MRYVPTSTTCLPTAVRTGLVLVLLWLLTVGGAAAQVDSLGGLVGKLARYGQRGPQEQLFLHLDRPLYLTGETLWLKVYAVEAATRRPLPFSSVAYVEVLDARNQPVLQGKIPLQKATGQGSFELPATLASGYYTVRAYTGWMKNFGPEAYFHTTITVLNTAVASGAAPTPDSAATAADAQFFPEGGNLVAGLESTVGVKVTGPTGRGLTATGKVLNSQGETVATFRTLHRGMGSFRFTPATAAATYTAVLTLGSGQIVTRPLPRAYAQGYVLHLANAGSQLTVTVQATANQPETVYLLAHTPQQVAVARRVPLAGGQATLTLDKSTLPAGVSHFTLFSTAQQPLCERLYFRPPQQHLDLAVRPDKPQYAPREQVRVTVAAPGDDAPTPANLSMAVYRLDSLNATAAVHLDQYLWLTSELRGTVEDPAYYLADNGPDVAEATDNLLLTQGWSRFRWEAVLNPQPLAYLPEPNGPVVQGQLTRAGTDQPQANLLTYLSLPGRLPYFTNSLSNSAGRVQFEIGPIYGPREMLLQTNPDQDTTARITLLPAFSPNYRAAALPTFGLLPRFAADYAKRHLQAQVQHAYFGSYPVRAPRPPADSLAFYGPPSEAYLLDKYTRFKVMEEVLREYVPGVVVRIRQDGFHFLVLDNVNRALFQDNPLVLLDGVPVHNLNHIMALTPLKVRKLEVVDSRYFHGPAQYPGIVSFSTYKGDLEGFRLDPRVLVQQYEGLQLQREFYAPRYETAQQQRSRLPDLRNLLYWNPNVTAGPTPTTLDFYTGDQVGRYLVVVQGLSATGLAGSTQFTFEVKQAL